MWKFINSPIVIVIALLVAFVGYQKYLKPSSAKEMREIYDEIVSISVDAKDDLERKKIVKSFVQEAATQVLEGAGFSVLNSEKKALENRLFFETLSKITVTETNSFQSESSYGSNITIIYTITNGSEEHLSAVAHRVSLYKGDTLVYVKDEYGRAKFAPGETKPFSIDLRPKSNIEFDTVKITLDDISIMPVAK